LRIRNPARASRRCPGKNRLQLLLGTLQARSVINPFKPAVVVGFGGYPTFPPMFAARLTGTPSILHEANGVMGRANKPAGQRA
jgi:UDP-N-acetylglucosamine--N-acetylmuramyl-(pentapeptide) pyrophosphoryl-undecaprenol N-acetylglucosamine transferase